MLRERLGGWVLTVSAGADPSWEDWQRIAREQDSQAEVVPDDDHDCPMLRGLTVWHDCPQGSIRFTRTINLPVVPKPEGIRIMRERGYFPGPCIYVPR